MKVTTLEKLLKAYSVGGWNAYYGGNVTPVKHLHEFMEITGPIAREVKVVVVGEDLVLVYDKEGGALLFKMK